MYGNNFFNPYTYQQPYRAASLANNLTRSSANLAGNLSRNSALATGLGKTSGLGLGNLLGKFSFTGFLNGASKTLNVINQAIPIFYQVKPIINNAKTMFRIMGAVKDDKPTTKQKQNIFTTSRNTTQTTNTKKNNITTQNTDDFQEENPTFFI